MPRKTQKTTCKHCDGIILTSCTPHSEDACPLQAAFFCMHCHTHGHSADQCQKQPPEYCYTNTLAGTISSIIRRKTAEQEPEKKEKVSKRSVYYPARELLENDKVLREFVRSHIGIPALKLEENKARIKEWTKTSGWKIRYIPDEEVHDQFAKYKYDEAYLKANPHIDASRINTETEDAQK